MPTTVRPTTSGERHLDTVRALWDALRAWDNDHQLQSDLVITGVLLVTCSAALPSFGGLRIENVLIQVSLLLPLIWRRQAPTLVFLIIASVAFLQWITTVPLPADVSLLVALFTLAVHASPSRALMGTGVMLSGVIMASIRWAPAGDVGKSLVFLSGLVIASLFIGFTLRMWRTHMDSLVERTKRVELERDQQAELAAAAERARIAREMHDVVAHNVSIMVTLADGALASADSSPGRAKEAMADVSATGRLALADMRNLLGVLRTEQRVADREPQPQLSGLPGLIEGVRATGLAIEFSEAGTPFALPPGVELTIFRIIQESLTNVLKHSDGPSATQVALTFEEPFVNVSIRDDGARPNPRPEGHGLGGMRERAAICGGGLTAGPQRERGWEVMALVRADQ